MKKFLCLIFIAISILRIYASNIDGDYKVTKYNCSLNGKLFYADEAATPTTCELYIKDSYLAVISGEVTCITFVIDRSTLKIEDGKIKYKCYDIKSLEPCNVSFIKKKYGNKEMLTVLINYKYASELFQAYRDVE